MVNPANLVLMIGHLATNPEAKTTTNGVIRCSFRLAVGTGFKGNDGREQADFFTVVTWRDLAQRCQNYLSKGRMVSIVGSVKPNTYTGQDGMKRTEYQIVADQVKFLSAGTRQQQGEAAPPPEYPDDFAPVDDPEVPF